MCGNTNDADFQHVAEDDDICHLYEEENWRAIRSQFAKTVKANRERGNQNRFYFPYSDVVLNMNGDWRKGTDWRIIRHEFWTATALSAIDGELATSSLLLREECPLLVGG